MNSKPFSPLAALFEKMDAAYETAAAGYGFVCNGCEDNCCRSLFFHHTHVEKAWLLYGFRQLAPAAQKDVILKARSYVDLTFSGQKEAVSQKRMCPLNEKGMCRLYPFRPMICRLHGLPHELNRPGAPKHLGPGCAAGRFEDKAYVPFDRTPFYIRMAQIEQAFRQEEGITGKIRETIAQMLL